MSEAIRSDVEVGEDDATVVELRRRPTQREHSRTDWTDDRFFGEPPGPEGYIVIALKSPANRRHHEWIAEELAKGVVRIAAGTTVEDYIDPDDEGIVQWSRDHLLNYHGWTPARIDAWIEGKFANDHDEEHRAEEELDNALASGGSVPDDYEPMPVPHTHGNGAEYAIVNSPHRELADRRAMLHIWQCLPDR
jgi:hypothetical protein